MRGDWRGRNERERESIKEGERREREKRERGREGDRGEFSYEAPFQEA